MRPTLAPAALLLSVLLIWEIVARRFVSLASVVRTRSAILGQYWNDGDLYVGHVSATIQNACWGFVIGNTVAIAAAVAFCRFRFLETLFLGVNITLFAIPPIVIGPILVLILHG